MSSAALEIPGELKRTPLFERHKRLGARFVEFGGWEMPVQYSGVIEEHKTVREAVGLFDVSHMGEIFVSGPNATRFLQWVTTNDIRKLGPNRAQYSQLLNHEGGVIDDIIVYELASEKYLVCVNASNREKDYLWLKEQNKNPESGRADVVDASDRYGQIAIQGPKAAELVSRIWKDGLAELKSSEFSRKHFSYFHFRIPKDGQAFTSSDPDVPTVVARTGYTGEDGFEVFCSTELIGPLFDAVIEVGANLGLKPIGLGARDTLRLEAGLPLHGHELRPDITPLTSGFSWVVKLDKGEFIGRDILVREKDGGSKKTLVGFEVLDRGIVRDGAPILDASGKEIGWSCSGTKTPSLDLPIGFAFVDSGFSKLGTEMYADVRGRKLKIRTIKAPFYKSSHVA